MELISVNNKTITFSQNKEMTSNKKTRTIVCRGIIREIMSSDEYEPKKSIPAMSQYAMR